MEILANLQLSNKKEMPLLKLWNGGLPRGYCISDSQHLVAVASKTQTIAQTKM